MHGRAILKLNGLHSKYRDGVHNTNTWLWVTMSARERKMVPFYSPNAPLIARAPFLAELNVRRRPRPEPENNEEQDRQQGPKRRVYMAPAQESARPSTDLSFEQGDGELEHVAHASNAGLIMVTDLLHFSVADEDRLVINEAYEDALEEPVEPAS